MRRIVRPAAATGADGTVTRTGPVLAVVGLSLMAVVSAVSGLNVALPQLARDTGATQAELTWIVDAYTVVFAGLLLLAGALGDRFGRRLLLSAGLVVFAAGASGGLVSSEPGQLILFRAVMGLGAAAIMPTTLSVITTSFPEAERPRAIGVWVGIAGGGAVLGLFGSALLLEWFSWSSFFALNIALAVLALVGTVAVVPASIDADPPALDVVGGLLSLVTVAALVFGIIEAPVQGWSDPVTVVALVVGLLAGVLFVAWELRVPRPLLDPRLFRHRAFAAGTLTITVQFFAAFGFFFIVLQYLQFVTGRSPLEAATALLPLPFVLLPTARNAPHLAQRIGFRWTGAIGLLAMAAAFLLLSRLEIDSPYWYFLIGLLLFGLGMGLAGTPATTAITAALPETKQGVASAVNDTAREVGSAFGIAVLGAVLNQSYRDALAPAAASLPPEIAERVLGSVGFTASPAIEQLGEAGQRLVEAGRAAFLTGVGDAVLVGGLVLAATALVVFVGAGAGASRRSPETAAVPASRDEAPAPAPAEGASEAGAEPSTARG